MQQVPTIIAFIDRIDGGVATLLLGDDGEVLVRIPAAWLPAGAAESMTLRISCELDAALTDHLHADIEALHKSLPNEP